MRKWQCPRGPSGPLAWETRLRTAAAALRTAPKAGTARWGCGQTGTTRQPGARRRVLSESDLARSIKIKIGLPFGPPFYF